ncbi:hypothetical protein HDU67_008141 [Dinochytrium kinnereticum]|nr:hypothetical protein HDU67_008141 [Dinochytrium kinnereticum]
MVSICFLAAACVLLTSGAVGQVQNFGGISKGIQTGAQALAAAPSICSPALNAQVIDTKREDLDDLLDQINAGIQSSSGARKTALQCQKNILQVFRNTCELEFFKKVNNRERVAINTAQIPNNSRNVDENCNGNINRNLFLGDTGAPAPNPASPPAQNNGQRTNFSQIAKGVQTGAQALTTAPTICPATLGVQALDANRIQLDSLLDRINAGIQSSSGARKSALQCEKNILQVFRNTCELEKFKKLGNQQLVGVNTAQLPNNARNVDLNCNRNIDRSLFL